MNDQIRRDPGAQDVALAAGTGRDESPPVGRGLFRRLAPAQGSALVGVMGALEIPWAPRAKESRDDIQQQRRVGQRNPSATEPPGDDLPADENAVAAPGRRGTPFSGYIVLRPPADS